MEGRIPYALDTPKKFPTDQKFSALEGLTEHHLQMDRILVDFPATVAVITFAKQAKFMDLSGQGNRWHKTPMRNHLDTIWRGAHLDNSGLTQPWTSPSRYWLMTMHGVTLSAWLQVKICRKLLLFVLLQTYKTSRQDNLMFCCPLRGF